MEVALERNSGRMKGDQLMEMSVSNKPKRGYFEVNKNCISETDDRRRKIGKATFRASGNKDESDIGDGGRREGRETAKERNKEKREVVQRMKQARREFKETDSRVGRGIGETGHREKIKIEETDDRGEQETGITWRRKGKRIREIERRKTTEEIGRRGGQSRKTRWDQGRYFGYGKSYLGVENGNMEENVSVKREGREVTEMWQREEWGLGESGHRERIKIEEMDGREGKRIRETERRKTTWEIGRRGGRGRKTGWDQGRYFGCGKSYIGMENGNVEESISLKREGRAVTEMWRREGRGLGETGHRERIKIEEMDGREGEETGITWQREGKRIRETERRKTTWEIGRRGGRGRKTRWDQGRYFGYGKSYLGMENGNVEESVSVKSEIAEVDVQKRKLEERVVVNCEVNVFDAKSRNMKENEEWKDSGVDYLSFEKWNVEKIVAVESDVGQLSGGSVNSNGRKVGEERRVVGKGQDFNKEHKIGSQKFSSLVGSGFTDDIQSRKKGFGKADHSDRGRETTDGLGQAVLKDGGSPVSRCRPSLRECFADYSDLSAEKIYYLLNLVHKSKVVPCIKPEKTIWKKLMKKVNPTFKTGLDFVKMFLVKKMNHPKVEGLPQKLREKKKLRQLCDIEIENKSTSCSDKARHASLHCKKRNDFYLKWFNYYKENPKVFQELWDAHQYHKA